MSKNYLCKDCRNNNNGWCTLKRKQGLKSVLSCESYSSNDSDVKLNEVNNVDDHALGKLIGSREVLFFIQKQILGSKKDTVSIDEVNEFLKIIDHHLSQFEIINNISVDSFGSEVDRDIYMYTKNYFNNLK